MNNDFQSGSLQKMYLSIFVFFPKSEKHLLDKESDNLFQVNLFQVFFFMKESIRIKEVYV